MFIVLILVMIAMVGTGVMPYALLISRLLHVSPPRSYTHDGRSVETNQSAHIQDPHSRFAHPERNIRIVGCKYDTGFHTFRHNPSFCVAYHQKLQTTKYIRRE